MNKKIECRISFKNTREAELFTGLVSDFKGMLQDMSDVYGFESDHCTEVLEDGCNQLWYEIGFNTAYKILEQESDD